jgi:hypothetical protein
MFKLIGFLAVFTFSISTFATGGQEVGGGGTQFLDSNGQWKVEEAFMDISSNKMIMKDNMRDFITFVSGLLNRYGISGQSVQSPHQRRSNKNTFWNSLKGPIRFVFVESVQEMKEKCELSLDKDVPEDTERHPVGCTSDSGTTYFVRKNFNRFASIKDQFLSILNVRLQLWCANQSDSLGWNCRDKNSFRFVEEFGGAVAILLDLYEHQINAIVKDKVPEAINQNQYNALKIIGKLALAVGLNTNMPEIEINPIGGGIGNSSQLKNSFIGVGAIVDAELTNSLVFMSNVTTLASSRIDNTWIINSEYRARGTRIKDSMIIDSQIDADTENTDAVDTFQQKIESEIINEYETGIIENVHIEKSELEHALHLRNTSLVRVKGNNLLVLDTEIGEVDSQLHTNLEKCIIKDGANITGASLTHATVIGATVSPTCQVDQLIAFPGSHCGENVSGWRKDPNLRYEEPAERERSISLILQPGAKISNVKIDYSYDTYRGIAMSIAANSDVKNLQLNYLEPRKTISESMMDTFVLGIFAFFTMWFDGTNNFDRYLAFTTEGLTYDFSMPLDGSSYCLTRDERIRARSVKRLLRECKKEFL